jgi:hypothetical protein
VSHLHEFQRLSIFDSSQTLDNTRLSRIDGPVHAVYFGSLRMSRRIGPPVTIESAEAAFKELHDVLLDQRKRIPVDKLFAEVKRFAAALPDFCLIVRLKKLFRSESEIVPGSEFLLFRYLSFHVYSNILYRFDDADAVYRYLAQHKDFVIEEESFYVLISRKRLSKRARSIVDLITTVFNVYFSSA